MEGVDYGVVVHGDLMVDGFAGALEIYGWREDVCCG